MEMIKFTFRQSCMVVVVVFFYSSTLTFRELSSLFDQNGKHLGEELVWIDLCSSLLVTERVNVHKVLGSVGLLSLLLERTDNFVRVKVLFSHETTVCRHQSSMLFIGQ